MFMLVDAKFMKNGTILQLHSFFLHHFFFILLVGFSLCFMHFHGSDIPSPLLRMQLRYLFYVLHFLYNQHELIAVNILL